MSVNVYLDQKLAAEPGIRTRIRGEGKSRYEQLVLGEVEISNDRGRLYIYLPELDSPIPTVLTPFVEEITYHDWIPALAPREAGIYRKDSAEVEIQPEEMGKGVGRKYRIRARGKNLAEVKELVHLVRVGKIRPDESYETAQGGLSRAELERENRLLCDKAAGWALKIADLLERNNALSAQLKTLRDSNERLSTVAEVASKQWFKSAKLKMALITAGV